MKTTNETRDELRFLLKRAGCYDLRTVTIMHRRIGVEDRWIGRSADAWLDSLSEEDALIVCHRLRGQA